MPYPLFSVCYSFLGSSMKSLFLTTIATITLLFAGCSDDTANASSENFIVPLAVGNTWEYTTVKYRASGDTTIHYSVSVTDKGIYYGRDAYIMKYTGGIDLPAYNDAQGFHRSVLPNEFVMMAKYPAKKGDSWSWGVFTRTTEAGEVLGTFEARALVISVDTVITVGGHPYHCYHYRFNDMPIELKMPQYDTTMTDYFYSINIGLIQEISYANGKESIHTELQSYSLK